jgi:predicted amidohydrolase
VVYAARCGTFHSPVPYGSSFLLLLPPWEALRVLRTVGTRYWLRCPMQGRSSILDPRGERVVQAGQEGETVLVAQVRPGAPDPARLPPSPEGRSLVPGMPSLPFCLDRVLIWLGRRTRRRQRQNR